MDGISGIFAGNRKEPAPSFWALDDINFDIQYGDAVGIVGRNGAGKSTLLKVLSRITQPTTGTLAINGRIASLLEVGTGFHPELTGRENIFLNGAILGMTRREIITKFDQIVDFSGIEAFLDTPVKHYSSGMYVRLAFAVAAHLEPEILIIDEVLAVGDAEFQKKCLGKMNDVTKNDGRTILFVSHSMAAVTTLCSRAMFLEKGKLQLDGEVAPVVERYMGALGQGDAEVIYPDLDKAPGTDVAKIRAIRLLVDGQVNASMGLDQELVIEMEFDNFKDGLRVNPNFHLMDQLGQGILSTVNWKGMTLGSDRLGNEGLPKGRFITRCTIPAHFLNEGSYSINAILLTDLTKVEARVDDVVKFSVFDFSEMRKGYARSWMGVVRPHFTWNTGLAEEMVTINTSTIS